MIYLWYFFKNRTSSSHPGNPMRDFTFNRMGSTNNGVGNQAVASWMDSLPRRDFYNMPSHSTNSLPRRDRAGLGRPEPPHRNISGGLPTDPGSDNGTNSFGMPRKRDSSLNRDNPFRDVLQAKGDQLGLEYPLCSFFSNLLVRNPDMFGIGHSPVSNLQQIWLNILLASSYIWRTIYQNIVLKSKNILQLTWFLHVFYQNSGFDCSFYIYFQTNAIQLVTFILGKSPGLQKTSATAINQQMDVLEEFQALLDILNLLG